MTPLTCAHARRARCPPLRAAQVGKGDGPVMMDDDDNDGDDYDDDDER